MVTIRIRVGSIPKYIRENPGSPLILTFILTLAVDAIVYPSDQRFANELTSNAFILLVIGVILQTFSLAKQKNAKSDDSTAQQTRQAVSDTPESTASGSGRIAEQDMVYANRGTQPIRMRLLKQITTVVFELIFAFSLMSTEAFAQSVNSDSQGGVGIFLATIGLLIALGAISLLIIALRFGSIEISIEEGSCNRTRDGIQDSCAEQSGTVHSCSEKTSG